MKKTETYYSRNREKCLVKANKYREANKEKMNAQSAEWRENNKSYHKKWNDANKESQSIKRKEYYEKNRDQELEYQRQFRADSPDYIARYHRKRRKEDPLFKLAGNLRSRISISFKARNWQKGSKTIDLIGCSFEEAKNHLISTMPKGYSWSDVGQVLEVDHKIPLSSAQTEEELIKLFHISNLQLLTRDDNRKKGDR